MASAVQTLHRQVHVRHGNIEADVDEGIADLIRALWRAGIQTLMSCQAFDSPGTCQHGLVWIVFRTKTDGLRFSTIGRNAPHGWPAVVRFTPTAEDVLQTADHAHAHLVGVTLSTTMLDPNLTPYILKQLKRRST